MVRYAVTGKEVVGDWAKDTSLRDTRVEGDSGRDVLTHSDPSRSLAQEIQNPQAEIRWYSQHLYYWLVIVHTGDG